MKPFKQSVLISLLILFTVQVAASKDNSVSRLSESDFFEEFPVVLTATRLKQPQKDAPIATTIIDRDMIEASGFTEIPDLLRLAPGMLVNYDSGHVLAAGYQFLFHRYTVRMQVIVDGRSVYTPTFGEVPWTQLGITIDDIDRIEVIRGPSSSSYGPNAMTAVISIITRHASRDKGVRAKLNIGHNGLSEQYISIGESTGNLDYRISVASRKNDGFESRYDGKNIEIFNFRGDYQLSNHDEITFNYNVNSSSLQDDNVIGDPRFHPEHIKKILNKSQQVKWTRSLNNGDNFSFSYYQQEYHDRNRYDSEVEVAPGIYFPIDNDESVKTNRQNLEFSHSIFTDNHDYSWGVILRKDKTVAPQYLYQVDEDTIDTKQLYLNTTHRASKANTINIGLLADDNDAAGMTFSSRLSLNHHLNSNNTLRLSYAKSFRNPFIFEENTNYVIPDIAFAVPVIWSDLNDLDSEEIRSFDIGIISYLNNKNTEIDLRLFRTDLTNLITLDEDIGGAFENGEAFHVKGLEASLKHSFHNTNLILNYAYTEAEADITTLSKPEAYETGTPKHNGSMLIIHKFNNSLTGSIGYYYTGEMHQLCCSGDLQEARKRLDTKISKAFKINSSNARISLVLQNITNEEVETRLLNNYDRRGYLGFSLEL